MHQPLSRNALASLLLVASLAACGGADRITSPSDDAVLSAITTLDHLADSVAHTDAATSAAYSALSEAIRLGGRVSPITITVDGVPTTFLATAHQLVLLPAPCDSTHVCIAQVAAPFSVRTLLAFQQGDPRHVIQLASNSDADSIAAYLVPTFAPFPYPTASFLYMDGTGAAWFGSHGSQRFSMQATNVPCLPASPNRPVVAIYPAPPVCLQAKAMVTFSATAEPSSFLRTGTVAKGTHTFSMAPQPVLGALFEGTALIPPLPPIKVTTPLPATLTAKMDSVLTLTLTVRNDGAAPADVFFTSGKHAEFRVADASGALLWSSSMGVFFTQSTSIDHVSPGGTLTYTATWKPTVHGLLNVSGDLTSASHGASARAQVVVP